MYEKKQHSPNISEVKSIFSHFIISLSLPHVNDQIITEAGPGCIGQRPLHVWRQDVAMLSVPLLSGVLGVASPVMAKAWWLSRSVPREQMSRENIF